jgi:MFS family permease
VALGRGFGGLWTANALSNLADGLAFVSMPLLAASLTDDPRLVAGLATVYAAVRLLVALPVGVHVDRLDRRALIVVANLARAVAVVVLATAVHVGFASVAVLYAAMAVVATLESTADNAAVAVLPSLVGPADLDRANGRVSAAQLVADEFVGPPLGGVLFAVAAALPVFVMGGLWAAAGAVALAIPPRPHRPAAAVKARDGIRWLARHRTVGALAVIGGLASVGYMLAFSVLVLFADERLGLDSTGYGLILSASATGGLVATAITARVRAVIGYRWTIVASLLLGAGSLAALSVTTHPVAAAVWLALYILHAVVWGICSVSLRQRLVPAALRGRVNAAARVLGLLGLALGSVLGGLLGAVAIAVPVAVGAAVFVVCGAVAAVMLPGADPADAT